MIQCQVKLPQTHITSRSAARRLSKIFIHSFINLTVGTDVLVWMFSEVYDLVLARKLKDLPQNMILHRGFSWRDSFAIGTARFTLPSLYSYHKTKIIAIARDDGH